jgi:hypothetical protein
MRTFPGRGRTGAFALLLLAATVSVVFCTAVSADAEVLCLKPNGEFGSCATEQQAPASSAVLGPQRSTDASEKAPLTVRGVAPVEDSVSILLALAVVGLLIGAFALTWRDS